MVLIRRLALVSILALVITPAFAGAPSRAPAPKPRPAILVPSGFDIAASAGISGQTAFVVIDAATGTVLEALQPNLPLPPASVAKVPTALYALDRLGPEYRFQTRLLARGTITAGRLNGDLILQGGGDPELDSDGLDALIAASGIRAVTGRLLVDEGIPLVADQIDGTQPLTASYNPAVGGLNVNFNRVYMEWQRKAGRYEMMMEARADRTRPAVSVVTMDIVDQTATGEVFSYRQTAQTEAWQVAQSALGARGGRWLPLRNPGRHAGDVFRALAAGRGMVLPPAAPVIGATGTVLATVEGRPLREIVRAMLKYSTNLTAEAIGLAATRQQGGVLTLRGSAAAMNDWTADYVGPGSAPLAMANHSGLTGDSRATVGRLAALLLTADAHPLAGKPFADLLKTVPVTERGVAEPRYPALVQAKTGTLNFTSALAGYLEVEGGQRMIFAILSADVPRRDALLDPSVETPPGARSWGARARIMQRALLRSWIDRFGR